MSGLMCNNLAAFVDGELEPGRMQLFQLHIGECRRCRFELHTHMQLEVITTPKIVQTESRSSISVTRWFIAIALITFWITIWWALGWF